LANAPVPSRQDYNRSVPNVGNGSKADLSSQMSGLGGKLPLQR